jgi:hypothetical protein
LIILIIRLSDLALPLRRECMERSRRVFGPHHPDTLEHTGDLGQLLFDMDDSAAAAPLLREAVQGLTDVYSAEHPHVRHYQSFLNVLSDAEEEEETMYQRMAKRRRRE